ncbi:FlxA-like family protein [Shewanella mesophila]|uniref:FlxA-like family protein n=1 Tax=Shewanella mesophila TaxID=2864208 RepID=UPI001C65F0A1|nr:FlxA-like family protein [Shewanella mesophila]QYJ86624.1 FlxA-like family protein [Shewanella mesophila]
MNIQGINQQSLGPTSLSRLTVVAKDLVAVKETAASAVVASSQESSQVSISSEGRQALASELGGALHARVNEMQETQQAAASDKSHKPSLDELIEQRKEKIKALQQELKALANDKSETAEKRRAQIRTEIAVLSAQIADLMEQKAENEKQSSAI